MRNLRRFLVRTNRIYIMPTTAGFLYLCAVVVLILTASTYNNNLIFILAFFLFAVFVVSMLQTHYNLKGIRLKYIGSEEAFESDHLGLNFYIEQQRARTKQSLLVRTRSKQFKTVKNQPETMLPDERLKPIRIEIIAWKRGVHPLPEVLIETMFPLGLFRSWKVFRPQGQLTIYPRPEGAEKLEPRAYEHGEQDVGLRNSPEGDFGELKNYLPGESYHQIAWKHYARTGELFTKVHWGAEDRHYQIPWKQQKDLETQLRQMSEWIRRANEENASFEMETPSLTIQPGRGFEHAKLCWRALAHVRGA